MKKEIAVLGAGAWGTAIASLLAHNGHRIRLWCYEQEVCDDIIKTRKNARYFPDIVLSERIIPTCSLHDSLAGADFIFEAVPVAFLRSILELVRPFYTPEQRWIILSKGIEQERLLLPAQILDSVMGGEVQKIVCVGPSFAHDLAHQQITAVSLAAKNDALGKEVGELLVNDFFSVAYTTDVIGVGMAAALKNVIALGIGILDGAGYHDNTKAFFLTRSLADMSKLVTCMGGRQETVYGLAGVGDLVLTSLGQHSRNLAFGRHLGQGHNLADLAQKYPVFPEGVGTIQSVYQLMEQKKCNCFIFRSVYEIIFHNKSIEGFLKEMVE